MAIFYYEDKRIFKLDTSDSSYVIQVDKDGFLLHLYYGAKIPDVNLPKFANRCRYASFSATTPEADSEYFTGFTPDTWPFEIGCNGCADMRKASLQIRNADGNAATDVRYVSHKIYAGKPGIPGMPALFANEDGDCATLEIVTLDKVTGAEVTLVYTVFEKLSAMTRGLIVKNTSDKPFDLERVLSFCMDMNSDAYDLISLYGRHMREREFARRPLAHGTQGVYSRRGSSSHSQNPFIALISKGGNEEYGEAFGFNLVYSGNFSAIVDVDYNNSSRVMMGINPDDFCWTLGAGETFYTPEAVLVYSANGLGDMSRTFHRLYNRHLVRGEWAHKKRPLLVNNWEGTGMDFDDEKLYAIAEWAKETGLEMFVMDDGWFGKRDDDTNSLGDWVVNEKKLKGGIGALISRVKALGLKFGIWYEPEMISPDSDIYRAHPDWCIHVPGRDRSLGRHQCVMDMTRADVRDYLFNIMSEVLAHNDIDYLKWDFNRNISEAGSALLPPERQKEFYHRYVLGTYELLDRITKAYPHLLLEGCSGGGGRFDPGMLYYTPQIWCSDNTDALSRLDIQFGTSLCYPASTQGAHVSASPRTGYETKRNVAMWGTFGYELDPAKISEEARAEIKAQIADYHKYYDTIHYGDLYRLICPWDDPYKAAWEFVNEEKTQALFTMATKLYTERRNLFIRLKGLDPEKQYRLTKTNEVFSGALLMNAGLSLWDYPIGDGESFMLCFEAV